MLNQKPLSTRVLLLVSMVLTVAGYARAQRPGSAASGGRVTPDRVELDIARARVAPATAANCPTEKGTYSFSYGFSANAQPRQGGAQTEKAGLAFAAYFTCRMFVEIDNDNVVSIKPAAANRVTGLGDTTVYLGVDALSESKSRPALTLLYGIKAPSASATKGLGSGQVDHTLIAAIGKTFSDGRTYLEFDGGDYIAGRVNASGFDHLPFASAFLSQKLGRNSRCKLHLEVGGDFATTKSNADMYSLNYLETRLSKKEAKTYVGLRTGARIGLTPNISRAGLYLALKVAGNLKDIFR
jgi:hypothetical protein